MSLLLAVLLLIVLIIVLLAAGFFLLAEIIALFQTKGVPYVPSFNEDLRLLKEKLSHDLNGKTMLDLGCGDGKALRFFDKNFGIKSGVGYDVNYFAILYGKILNRFHKTSKIKLLSKNFKNANLKEFDYIYMYLFPKTMKEYENWIFENISENTIIISNSFQFETHQPYETINLESGKPRFYFYKKS